MCNEALDLMKKKNADYAGSGGNNPFANFERAEAMGICSTEQGFLVRMIDKMSRLSTYTSKGKLVLEDETVYDTLIDMINYTVLLSAYLKGKSK
jgi:hypothetical protein